MRALITSGARTDAAVDTNRRHAGAGDSEGFSIANVGCIFDSAAKGDGKAVVLTVAFKGGSVNSAGKDEVL